MRTLLAMVLVVLASLLAQPALAAGSFSDLSPADWAYADITALAQEGIIAGYPDGTFQPTNRVTRAEIAKLLVKAAPGNIVPVYPAIATFPDLGRKHWAFGYVEAAVAHGFLNGYPDGTFRPADLVSKAEIIKMIVAAKGWNLTGGQKSAFLDSTPEEWFNPYLNTALSWDILRIPDTGLLLEVTHATGVSSTQIDGYLFEPQAAASRAQAAVLLYRMRYAR